MLPHSRDVLKGLNNGVLSPVAVFYDLIGDPAEDSCVPRGTFLYERNGYGIPRSAVSANGAVAMIATPRTPPRSNPALFRFLVPGVPTTLATTGLSDVAELAPLGTSDLAINNAGLVVYGYQSLSGTRFLAVTDAESTRLIAPDALPILTPTGQTVYVDIKTTSRLAISTTGDISFLATLRSATGDAVARALILFPTDTPGPCCSGVACSIRLESECTGPSSAYAAPGNACNAQFVDTTPCCRADFNHDGAFTPAEIFAYLNSYFNTGKDRSLADWFIDGTINQGDLFSFIAAYFARAC